MAEIRSDEPLEGEYTDSELPADAVLPKDADADVNDGDWNGNEDAVIVEETDAVVIEDEGEYTDSDFEGERRRDGI